MPISATGNDRGPSQGLSGPARPQSRGFTLAELLVVVFLIGLLVSLAVLALRGDSPSERLEREAARLHARMDLAREEAVLRAQSLGLQVEPGAYRFFELTEGGWQTLNDDRLLAEHELPDGTHLRARLDGIEIVLDESTQDAGNGAEDEKRRPQIFFLASGELVPDFTLTLSADDTEAEFAIEPGDERWLDLTGHER